MSDEPVDTPFTLCTACSHAKHKHIPGVGCMMPNYGIGLADEYCECDRFYTERVRA